MFLNTLVSSKKNGIDKIRLIAAKSNMHKHFGYKVWPKFGFDFDPAFANIEIPEFRKLVSKSNIPEIKNSKNLRELFETKTGQEFWSENGFEFHGIFDVKVDYDYFISYFRSKL